MTETIVDAATPTKCSNKVDTFDSVQKDKQMATSPYCIADANHALRTSEPLPSETPEGPEQSERGLRVEFSYFSPFHEPDSIFVTVAASGLSDFHFELPTEEAWSQFNSWRKERGFTFQRGYRGFPVNWVMMTECEYIELKLKWAGWKGA